MSVILLLAGIVLCFAASWILLPPFILGLMPFTVAVPELAPWFFTASAVVCALSYRWSAVNHTSRAALYLAAAAAVLSTYPLVRVPLTIPAFDRAMQDGLGSSYERQMSSVAR